MATADGCCGDVFASEPNDILQKLNQSVKKIKNLSAQIEYTHSQPLFETQTVRVGKLFYVKDANNSALRINFLSLKQDDLPQQKYREDYIFDGFKLTKIDFQSKSVTAEQLAKDKPIEPFELVQSYFPIIGFSESAALGRQFHISVKQTEPQIFLRLIPKEKSEFFKTYKQIDCGIDPENSLPFDFSALTCDDEKITIRLTKINTTAKIKMNVFDVDIPADFTKTQKIEP
ncbi:MAG: outer-membrane lipoprotein carrier protein LolA [Phycisphaerae bacterium]|nr:outer-membrane lipoprotein carrier protein LolA [Phycisphaerae bacterium]